MFTAYVYPVFVAVVITVIEVFFLTRWLRKRDQTKDRMTWSPFKILFYESTLRYGSMLHLHAQEYIKHMDEKTNAIRENQELSYEDIDDLKTIQRNFWTSLENIKNEYFFLLQTVAPSLEPHAAQVCSRVLGFDWTIRRTLEDVDTDIGKLYPLIILDKNNPPPIEKDVVERPLTSIAFKPSMLNLSIMSFSSFPLDLKQTAKELDNLHYSENENAFVREEQWSGLEQGKQRREYYELHDRLNPRTMPIKTFWESDEEFNSRLSNAKD
ncbi:hypothetical protein SLH49_12980 [Cognatiyoonia sp. IB215446]|uniref:hypothetical protein n=1 Tax=Cognatiyoonia sp. IB215446 TaxID=3097355 RepID=UPI002A185C2B|nr:hypothetical protein [Cognatiyoonia sp. IB215446]MDX8348893.1 hypothetical protein [Cognatiyoonia sp. IB215446]